MLSALPIAADGKSLSNAVWVDLVDPSSTETAAFEKAFGLSVPNKDEVSEIETTSRLHVEQDTLYMTAPLIMEWRRTMDSSPDGLCPVENCSTDRPLYKIDSFRGSE